MFRIDDATAATSLPTPETAGTEGYFTEGNPTAGTPATNVRGSWLNMIQEELRAVVVAGGLTPSKTTYNQVLAAIKRIGQNTVVLADTGAANAYTAVNAVPLVAGTWVDGVVQQVKIAHANTGASTYAPDGLTAIPIYGLGLQPLQGGELALNGTAVLMHATIAGVNSGNPIAVLMECAGGAQQIAPATQSQHAVQMGQAAGVVGSVRNLVMSVTAASASATLTADEIIVETALGGVRYCLPSFSKTINLATTGAGGMDTGSAPTSGFVAIYAIYNPTTGTSALLATNASAAAQPHIYGGANMPSGYTASALVSVWGTNASSQLNVGFQQDRAVTISAISQVSSSSIVSAQSLVLGTPRNTRSVNLNLFMDSTAGTNGTLLIAADSGMTLGARQANCNSAFGSHVSVTDFQLRTSQTIFYSTTNAAGTPTFTIQLTGYYF